MKELKTVREQAIDHLSVIDGPELDITCNITSSQQLGIVMESEAHSVLGCRYIVRRTERLLRLTNGFQARHRQDIVEIAKSSAKEGEVRCRGASTSRETSRAGPSP